MGLKCAFFSANPQMNWLWGSLGSHPLWLLCASPGPATAHGELCSLYHCYQSKGLKADKGQHLLLGNWKFPSSGRCEVTAIDCVDAPQGWREAGVAKGGLCLPAHAVIPNNRSHHSVPNWCILTQQNKTAPQAAPLTSDHSTFFPLCSSGNTWLCFPFAPLLLFLSPPKHTPSPKQAAPSWLLHPAGQGVSRDKSSLLPSPTLPG